MYLHYGQVYRGIKQGLLKCNIPTTVLPQVAESVARPMSQIGDVTIYGTTGSWYVTERNCCYETVI